MKLIVGLGNPGLRYAATRHNAGWRVAEALAARAGATGWREKFEALLVEARRGDEKVVLARPVTYMNLSGQSVREMFDFWKVELSDLLVIVDDLALDLGRIRLRPEGSAGGHNGLESIIAHLGSEQFARVRVGMGPMPKGVDQAAFVLSEFSASERPIIEEAVDRAADAAECWICNGLQEAMNRFNRSKED
ncbi:MAG: aminoacyl-tRNA hydrolase [Planctomycetota bacterium]|nr:aminoacyl-tRNA hydrolase [Planctomycetota bacterium]